MALDPQFASTVKHVAKASTGTADTSHSSPSSAVTLVTAATNGTKITEVVLIATATTSAGVARLWVHDGSTYFLYDEIAVPAITASDTVPALRSVRTYQNLTLQTGYTFRMSLSVSTVVFHINVECADL